MELDHLAVVAADLDAGAAHVASALGIAPGPGGRHARFGTHNLLLSLGPGLYLEVIAPDPAAPSPAGPRWFGLDRAGAPRLGNWIVRAETLEGLPPQAGVPVAMTRGDLAWEIAVPPDGGLPWDGAFPSVIAWRAGRHPADLLPDHGLRLLALTVLCPDPAAAAARLAGRLADARVVFAAAPAVALRARIATPAGERVLA
jgi:hypothetical protein